MTDQSAKFREALASAGIPLAGELLGDGKIHRYKGGEDKDANSWYVFHQNGSDFAAGAFGCWKRQLNEKWHSGGTKEVSPEERRARAKLYAEAQAQAAAEELKRHTAAAANAKAIVEELSKDGLAAHPYLERKRCGAYGDAGLYGDLLTLPLRTADGALHSLQFIDHEGSKRYLFGGRKRACFFSLSDRPDGPIVICEGYATAASIFEATGYATVAAMDCGNLEPVYLDLRKRFPGRFIILAADNDQWTDGNPGRSKVQGIALKAKDPFLGTCHPVFDDVSSKPTDFNDLANLDGPVLVRDCLRAAFPLPVRKLAYFEPPPPDDPAELIKHRWLCRAGFGLLTAPTGVGKSTLIMQLMALWANALPAFGMDPTKALRFVLVQAENDGGDLAEMRDGVIQGLNFNAAQARKFTENVLVYTSRGEQGLELIDGVIRPLLDWERPDMIIIDPFLAYIGGDASSQTVCNNFLRVLMQPVITKYQAACLFSHHISKPGKRDKDTVTDPLYSSFGSSEIQNIFRAQLVMEKTTEQGTYCLRATKREDRLRWRDDHGDRTNQKFIARSTKDGVLCWHEVASSDAPEEHQEKRGRQPIDHFPTLCSTWKGNPITRKEIIESLIASGLSEATSYRAFNTFVQSSKIISVQPHSNPLTFIKNQ